MAKLLLVFLVLIVLLGCTTYELAAHRVQTASMPEVGKLACFENLQVDWQLKIVENNNSYVFGIVKNGGDKDIKYFEIAAKYMDLTGIVYDIDSLKSYVVLKPGSQTEFEFKRTHKPEYKKVSVWVRECK